MSTVICENGHITVGTQPPGSKCYRCGTRFYSGPHIDALVCAVHRLRKALVGTTFGKKPFDYAEAEAILHDTEPLEEVSDE